MKLYKNKLNKILKKASEYILETAYHFFIKKLSSQIWFYNPDKSA